jgi:ankyrin repeat protein
MDAASTGNCFLLEQMLSVGIHANVQAEDGYTALQCAAKTRQVAIIRLLLGKGAAVDSRNAKCHQRRPIHEAIAMLLHAGADLLLPDAKGQTVIDHIGLVGNVQSAQTLFSEERKQKPPSEMASLLLKACVKSGNHLTLRWLLSQFPSALSQSMELARSTINTATRRKMNEILAILLSSVEPSSQSSPEFIKSISYSLYLAASRGSDVLVQRLLMCDTIDPNQKFTYSGRSPLHSAVSQGNFHAVEMLLDHPRIDVNIESYYGDTPLHLAAISGEVKVIKLLLLHKNIDVQSKKHGMKTLLDLAFINYKWNALRLIADHHNLTAILGPKFTLEDTPTAHLGQDWPLIRLLLDHGLLSKEPGPWVRLLEKVVVAGEIETVKFLVDCMSLNVYVFEDTVRGNTILHVAAEHHRHEIFRLYFEDTQIDENNQVRQRGYSVLHHAIKHNCMTAVKLLLARPETDIELRDIWGRTALDIARKLGKREIFDLLLSHGAVGNSLEMDPTIADRHAHEQGCWTAQDEEELQGHNAQSNVVEVEDSDIDSDSGECEDADMSI